MLCQLIQELQLFQCGELTDQRISTAVISMAKKKRKARAVTDSNPIRLWKSTGSLRHKYVYWKLPKQECNTAGAVKHNTHLDQSSACAVLTDGSSAEA